MSIDRSWREAEAKWLQRPEFGMKRQMLQAISGDSEALAGYEGWRDQLDELWSKLFARPTIKLLDEIFFALPSEDRAHALIFAFERIESDDLFWIALAKWWSSFDAIDHVAMNELMRRRSAAWT